MLGAATHCGLYGKIPAVGDFVTCRLPAEFIEAWDTWLQSGLNHWRLSQGNEWSNRFDAAGGFRFAFEENVCGPAPVIGVVVASKDRVGRRFPLTIAAVLPAQSSALVRAMRARKWFEDVTAALRAIGHEFFDSPTKIESLLLQLDPELALSADPLGAIPPQSADALLQAAPCHIWAASEGDLGLLVAMLSVDQASRRQPRLALIWTDEPRLNLWSCTGLPAVESFAGMFSSVMTALPAAPVFAESLPPVSQPEALVTSDLRAPGAATLRNAAHLLVAVANIAYVAFDAPADERAEPAAVARRFRNEFERSSSAPGACLATLGAEAGSCAAWLPDEEGGAYVWCGTATIFRLRGADLERLAGADQADAQLGDSLADLLGDSDAGSRPPPATTSRQPADVRAGDRILLCADGSYGRLSWAQLVSALQEEQPALAARRLQEAWTSPHARIPGAIVIAFDSEEDALVATHATVAAKPPMATA